MSKDITSRVCKDLLSSDVSRTTNESIVSLGFLLQKQIKQQNIIEQNRYVTH